MMPLRVVVCLSVISAWSTDGAAAGSQDQAGFVAAFASGVAFAVVGIVDIATAPSSARKHNQRSVGVVSWFDPDQRRITIAFALDLSTLRSGTPVAPAISTRRPTAKSPQAALHWSLGSTLIPTALGLGMATATGWNDNEGVLTVGLVMAGGGWLVGPSVGHWYAGQTGRGLATTGVRLGIAALGFLALTTVDFD